MELLIGCGNSRRRLMAPPGRPAGWEKLVTLDIDPGCGADVLADLEQGIPFRDNTFDEVHAYEVLEHLGRQGDFRAFFRDFAELYRVIKQYGFLVGTTPRFDGAAVWCDPGHTRVISPAVLMFLDQDVYKAEVGKNCRTDYRWLWKGNFRLIFMEDHGDSHFWVLQAIK